MNAAKIQLSKAEMKLANDARVILTKNVIIGKAVELLARQADRYRETFDEWTETHKRAEGDHDPHKIGMRLLAMGLKKAPPKVSRGEAYKGLPWVVLDYPRVFAKNEVLAVRTMFWWGYYFSITLHLKGQYHEAMLTGIRERIELLTSQEFYVGTSHEEWRHELSGDNYTCLKGMDIEAARELLDRPRPFLKIASGCDLTEWNQAPDKLNDLFRVIVEVCGF